MKEECSRAARKFNAPGFWIGWPCRPRLQLPTCRHRPESAQLILSKNPPNSPDHEGRLHISQAISGSGPEQIPVAILRTKNVSLQYKIRLTRLHYSINCQSARFHLLRGQDVRNWRPNRENQAGLRRLLAHCRRIRGIISALTDSVPPSGGNSCPAPGERARNDLPLEVGPYLSWR